MKVSPRVLGTMVLLNVLWAPVNLAFKSALEEWSPSAIGFVRWTVFALLLAVLLQHAGFRKRVRAKVPTGADAWQSLAIGAFLFAPAHFLYILCQRYTTTLEATVLGTTGPFWVALLAFALLGERVSSRRWLGIGAGCSGAYIVSLGWAWPTLSTQNALGNVMYLVAVLIESVGFVLAVRVVLRSSGIGVLVYQATGMGAAFLLASFLHPALGMRFDGFSGSTWFAMAYLTLVTSLICFSVWYAIAERVPLSVMVIMIGIQAPVSAFLGITFLGETLRAEVVVGSLVVLGAILVAATDRAAPLASSGSDAP